MLHFKRKTSIFIIDVIAILLMIAGLYQVQFKAGGDEIRNVRYHRGSDATTIVQVNGMNASSIDRLEFVLDGMRIGDTVSVITRNAAGDLHSYREVLRPTYSTWYMVVTVFVMLVFVVLGIFVISQRFGERSAHVFHHLCISVAVLSCTNPGGRFSVPEFLSLITLAAFFTSYALVPVLLLHFTFVFPKDKYHKVKNYLRIAYLLAAVVAVVLTFEVTRAIEYPVNSYAFFDTAFFCCRLLFIFYVMVSVIRIIRSYYQAESGEERRKILWVLLGFTVSVLSFAFLWLVPFLFFQTRLIPEEVVELLTVIAPITFAIAIIRYRVMDIEFIVNRGVVYVIVIALLVGVYAVFMTIAVNIVGQNFASLQVVIPLIIIINVLLFVPARRLVQRFVDRTFFRVQYNYRNTQRILLERINECLNDSALSSIVVKEVAALLHPERIAFVVFDEKSELRVLASESFNHSVISNSELYDQTVFAATYTMFGESGKPLGYLCCGRKKSGVRYMDEDIDLLVNVSTQSGAMLERFSLQEKIVMGQLESKRLTEMNELKSYFVSGVTHELKTPLTSIRLFAEMLQSHVTSDKAMKYLKIIEGESDRLTRLINNVLDYSKIERGVMDYRRTIFDVNEVVQHVIELMQYQIDINGFALEIDLSPDELMIEADVDALTEALINLIANSLKYSSDRKHIRISTSLQDKQASIVVEDQGIGIPPEHLKDIFTPFVRLKDDHTARAGGAGLGLALVNHFVDAHGGSVEVESEVGKGTSVRMLLPL